MGVDVKCETCGKQFYLTGDHAETPRLPRHYRGDRADRRETQAPICPASGLPTEPADPT